MVLGLATSNQKSRLKVLIIYLLIVTLTHSHSIDMNYVKKMMQSYSHSNQDDSAIDAKMDEILLKNHLSLLFTNSSPGNPTHSYSPSLTSSLSYSLKEYIICCHHTY